MLIRVFRIGLLKFLLALFQDICCGCSHGRSQFYWLQANLCLTPVDLEKCSKEDRSSFWPAILYPRLKFARPCFKKQNKTKKPSCFLQSKNEARELCSRMVSSVSCISPNCCPSSEIIRNSYRYLFSFRCILWSSVLIACMYQNEIKLLKEVNREKRRAFQPSIYLT